MKNIFFVAVIMICIYGNAWANDNRQEVFTVSSFHKTISDDAEAARAKFLEKPVTIRGTVARTYISRYLTPCVELVGGEPKITFVLPYGGITRGSGQLSNFKEGQNVVMTGILRAINDDIVVFKESRLAE